MGHPAPILGISLQTRQMLYSTRTRTFDRSASSQTSHQLPKKWITTLNFTRTRQLVGKVHLRERERERERERDSDWERKTQWSGSSISTHETINIYKITTSALSYHMIEGFGSAPVPQTQVTPSRKGHNKGRYPHTGSIPNQRSPTSTRHLTSEA